MEAQALLITILRGAIEARHAVTLSRGGQPIIAEPYALREQDGKTILTYLQCGRRLNDARRLAQNWVGVFSEVIDLGRSLYEIDATQEDEPALPRRPGRPPLRDEPTARVEVKLPVSLVDALDAATDNRTAFIERAIRAALAPAE